MDFPIVLFAGSDGKLRKRMEKRKLPSKEMYVPAINTKETEAADV